MAWTQCYIDVAHKANHPSENHHEVKIAVSFRKLHGVSTALKLSEKAQGADQKVDLKEALSLALSLNAQVSENVSWVMCSFEIVSSPNTQKRNIDFRALLRQVALSQHLQDSVRPRLLKQAYKRFSITKSCNNNTLQLKCRSLPS